MIQHHPGARPFVDVEALALPSFALEDEHTAFKTDLHSHWRHQLLFASSGTLRLEVADKVWLLPPQRAAWLSAGTPHITSAGRAVSLRTIYLGPHIKGAPAVDACVFEVTPLAREMILYAMRWGPQHQPSDRLATDFFSLLVRLCAQWTTSPSPSHLPRAQSPELARAMAFALARLDHPLTLTDAARAAGLSPRTLTRRFSSELNSSWRDFIHRARMIKAMELLAQPDIQVTQVAFAVGFESLGAFSQAFKRHTGQPPSAYRRSL